MTTLPGNAGAPTKGGQSRHALDKVIGSLDAGLAEHFEFIDATGDADHVDVIEAWRRLVALGQSAEQFYELPDFFNCMREIEEADGVVYQLYVLRRRSDGRIVGLIPGRRITKVLTFNVGPWCLLRFGIPVYQILGSVPLLDPDETGLYQFVIKKLLHEYPDCCAILMQAVPFELASNITGCNGMSRYVLKGWRACHTMPLPDTVGGYLARLTAKKRYNLSRQVRLLGTKFGAVALVRVEECEQVAQMLAAVKAALSPEDFSHLMHPAGVENMARHGLLHCYMLQCGKENVGVTMGFRSGQVWHVSKIIIKQSYMKMSVGSTMLHLAVQDLITNFSFTHIDFGYGSPNQEFRNTHVLKQRGCVMLFPSRSLARVFFMVHRIYDVANENLIMRVKSARSSLQQRGK